MWYTVARNISNSAYLQQLSEHFDDRAQGPHPEPSHAAAVAVVVAAAAAVAAVGGRARRCAHSWRK